jgi:hypothetical protein
MSAGPGELAQAAARLADRARLLAAQATAEESATGAGAPLPEAAAEGGEPAGAPELALVHLAGELPALARAALRLAVRQAHAGGHGWPEIGERLGISAQAAFQRFGQPDAPAAGEPVTPVIADAADRAIAVLADWFEERDAAVAATFDVAMAEKLPVAGLATARAQLAGTAGQYRRLGDGEPLVRQLGDYTVADVPLVFETGPMKGRVAFDRAGRVAGLYVLPPAVS